MLLEANSSDIYPEDVEVVVQWQWQEVIHCILPDSIGAPSHCALLFAYSYQLTLSVCRSSTRHLFITRHSCMLVIVYLP